MNINILGIPMDLGAGRRGVDMGPSALRNAQLCQRLCELGHQVKDLGDVPVALPETIDKFSGSGLDFRDPILEAGRATVERLRGLPDGVFPITIGGDHSIAIGTVAGNALRGSAEGHRMGLIWVDAHTDFNTPEISPSGNIHGMPVAQLCGLGDADLASLAGDWRLDPRDIVMIGIRSVDPKEAALVREHGIKIYTMKDVDQLGMTRIAEEALEYLSGVDRLHVSYDADALDPSVTPGTGTPIPGGLSYREGHLLMELLCESGRVTSLDIVEVNPILDDKNKTAEVMVAMAASLLGLRIL
ncbi:arginase [Deinococcus radiophilus]|uniref:Arginase n=1 Tax=Deinococcus radiophilus TaxID=32062 RepID=A0A431VQ65_9DEIO|nr:arginase [Deinococcus radiophilus]RTR25328.1 arginase [Deinococcus radiophilus]UFA50470.1 arginase [Deinococcus radiophilus]